MLKIKRILISQPQPESEKSPYAEIVKKHNVKIDFFKFFKIVGVSAKDFRMQRINLNDYTAVMMTSKNAVDHFFKLCEELRIIMPDETKYFCSSEAIALYLQKYVIYRKRKVFASKNNICELIDVMKKYKDERFLLPCAENHKADIPCLLNKELINFDKAIIYKTESENLSIIDLNSYDLFAFFSPSGIKSLFENQPNFVQGEKVIAVFGSGTLEEALLHGLKPQIIIPTKELPSMTMAIDSYLENSSKKKKCKEVTQEIIEPVKEKVVPKPMKTAKASKSLKPSKKIK
ncbi:MAG: uroporphyrinogen-III synthase [Bacteroidales bacterium]|nr:uroporphyrinogen-III synthase [Bacteroidales bacterium]